MALGVVGLSALTTSYLLGHQSQETGLALSASATSNVEQAPEVNPETVSEPSESPVPVTTATENPTNTPTPTKTVQPKGASTAAAEPQPAPAAKATGTYASEAVRYKYGTIQLEVSVADGVLTGINMLQATTEGKGYDQAPPILVDAALQAGGSNFGNLSGATFTTQAFKQALDDALRQAGM
jgi:uncharacterized protein with FMN-binding domain